MTAKREESGNAEGCSESCCCTCRALCNEQPCEDDGETATEGLSGEASEGSVFVAAAQPGTLSLVAVHQ